MWLRIAIEYIPLEQDLTRAVPKNGGAGGTGVRLLKKYLEDYDWEFSSENQQGYIGRKGAR